MKKLDNFSVVCRKCILSVSVRLACVLLHATVWILAMSSIGFPLASCSKTKQGKFETEQNESEKRNNSTSVKNKQSQNPNREKNSPRMVSENPKDEDTFQEKVFESLVADWNQAIAESKGEELLRRQWEIEKRATALGPGDALLRFFTFLSESGANDTRERVISEVGNAVFSGADAGMSRHWLLSVEDKELREKLCRFAGKFHPKEGIKEYIGAFDPDTKCQAAVLTGYCRNLTKTDPSGAVKAFMDLIPPTVTFEGLVEVMAALPPQSDFAAISTSLPGDTKNIAMRARAALLQSWTASKPEEAAQYVIANTTVASPEQMGVVVFNWCRKSPENAASWIEALSPSPIKDEGTAALAKYWMTQNPVKAWEFISHFGDSSKRFDIATEVFKEWEKTDREAATKAWIELFPTKNQ